jgi:two-component system NtrC family sensor kinase
LAVSYGIIQAHGGEIEVQSKVGAGTTFIVSLPLQQAPQPGEPLLELARQG